MINELLLIILIFITILILFTNNMLKVILLASIFSIVISIEYSILNAPDVAITEISVGTGVSTIFLFSSIVILKEYKKDDYSISIKEAILNNINILAMIMVVITGGVLIYGLSELDKFGSLSGPIHSASGISKYYIKNTKSFIGIPNIVTAILASFRGYDTFGETSVIFTAGISILLLLKNSYNDNINLKKYVIKDKILYIISSIMIPIISIFALYIQFLGDYSPGGGFQAGVILSVVFIIHSLVFGPFITLKIMPINVIRSLAALGIIIYGVVGIIPMFMGNNFLDYNALSNIPVKGQEIGIMLVESGVGITVFSVMLLIYFSFLIRYYSENKILC